MLSTGIELVGFGFITYAAYGWNHLVGWLVGGVFLVVIGYVFEDDKAAVSVAKMIHPVVRRWELRKIKRQAKASQ